jgi:hypothetical protein
VNTVVEKESRNFGQFWWRTTACHVVTYFAMGMAAYTVFQYRGLFEEPQLASFMKPVDSKWVAAGGALQAIRAVIIAAALYPFRQVFLAAPAGWLKLAGLLIGLSVLSTAGPSPGSFEGFVYTRLTGVQHLRGLPEVIIQNATFAYLLCGWYRGKSKAWGYVLGGLMALGILMSIAGVFAPRPEAFK